MSRNGEADLCTREDRAASLGLRFRLLLGAAVGPILTGQVAPVLRVEALRNVGTRATERGVQAHDMAATSARTGSA